MELKSIEQFLEEKYGRIDESSGIHPISNKEKGIDLITKQSYQVISGNDKNGLLYTDKHDMIIIVINGITVGQIGQSTLVKASKTLEKIL